MEFDEFLKYALPGLGYNWRPLRRRGVRRKILDRARKLHFCEFKDYLEYLKKEAAEQEIFKDFLTVTVSKFFRGRETFRYLKEQILPRLLSSPEGLVRILCLGTASGEEPYSIALLCAESGKVEKQVQILAAEKDPEMIKRGQRAVYQASSLHEIPETQRNKYFQPEGSRFLLRDEVKRRVTWMPLDIRKDPLPVEQHLILCSYLAFTYFNEEVQIEVLRKIHAALLPGGYLLIGQKERLPVGWESYFQRAAPGLPIFIKKP